MNDSPRKLIVFAITASLLGILLAWIILQVRSTLLTIYVSALFAMGMAPLVRLIERQRVVPIGRGRVPRWLAILVVYLAVLGIVAGIFAMIIPPLVEQARQLWDALPEYLQMAQRRLIEWGLMDKPLTTRQVLEKAPAGSTDAVTTVLGALVGVAGGLFGLVSILLLTFYMLVDAKGIMSVFVRLFPVNQRARVASVSAEIATRVSGWLGGQIVLALVIGSTTWIAMAMMGVPYSSVLAVIAAVGEAIPIVGPLLSAIPAILVALTVSPGLALGVAVFFMLQQQFENAILAPKVMERQVGVSAIVVIIALAMGGQLLGIVGVLLAVPTAAIVQVVFEELVLEPEEE